MGVRLPQSQRERERERESVFPLSAVTVLWLMSPQIKNLVLFVALYNHESAVVPGSQGPRPEMRSLD